MKLDPKILPIVTAAIEAGFTAYAPKETTLQRAAGFVYVCLANDGPFATVQVPSHPWEDAGLDVPIKPSREYGSSVLVDYDGTVTGAVEALSKACQQPNVTVRFVAKPGHAAPVVPNYGRKVIETWPGGPERFTTVTLADLETPEA